MPPCQPRTSTSFQLKVEKPGPCGTRKLSPCRLQRRFLFCDRGALSGLRIPTVVAAAPCEIFPGGGHHFMTARRHSVPMRIQLELSAAGRAGEGDHVANVGYAGDEHQHPLEAQTEAGMRHRAIAAKRSEE